MLRKNEVMRPPLFGGVRLITAYYFLLLMSISFSFLMSFGYELFLPVQSPASKKAFTPALFVRIMIMSKKRKDEKDETSFVPPQGGEQCCS